MWTYSSHPWSVTGVSDSNADLSVDGFEVFIPVDSDSHRTIRIAETYQSVSSDGLISITFENRTSESVLLKWHSFDGDLLDYSTVAAGATYTQGTYATHPWSAHGTGNLTVDGHEVYIPVQGDDGRTVYVTQAGSEVATDSTTLPTVTGTTGTIFLNGNWVPDTAATVYNGVTSTGACRRNMFDRRDDAFAMRDAWCFDTQFGDETKTVEIQVNSLDFD